MTRRHWAKGLAIAVLSAIAALFPPPALAGDDSRLSSVRETVAAAPSCAGLGDYYWAVGDGGGILAWGQQGSRITATRPIHIASASKWLWGAYVIERRQGRLTDDDIAALTMRSGHDGLNPLSCRAGQTVADCLPSSFQPGHVGLFSYDGGHDQYLAVSLGLGGMTGAQLADEMRRLLGADLDFTFRSPQPAGGGMASPADYGRFLQKIVAGTMRMSASLGDHAVCTLPEQCPQSRHSPAPWPWHYSLNHWVEDGPGDDGAFSSPGLFGFYPWISADRRYWGIFAREHLGRQAWQDSARCGALIRRAWMTGNSQIR